MSRDKLGVNDPCPCGSGKKYKKCHPGKYNKWGDLIPPDGVIAAAERFRNPIFPNLHPRSLTDEGVLTGRPFIDTIYNGARMRAVGSKVYKCPLNETFHQFILNRLWETLMQRWGHGWQTKQVKLPIETRHPLSVWFSGAYELVQKYMKPPDVVGFWRAEMTGEFRALLSFAYDMYTLEHHGVLLDEKIWQRIGIPDQFQGVRYEVAIAAMACRAGFRIEWCNDLDKHGEFIGTHIATEERIVFEAKTHTRSGILGKSGKFDPDKVRLKTVQHVHGALEQTKATGLPVLIFDDLNLPINEGKVDEQKWFEKIDKLFKKSKFYEEYRGSHYGGLIITNFAWHFHEILPKKPEGNDVISYWHTGGPFSIDPAIIRYLTETSKQYGFVPAKLEEMRKAGFKPIDDIGDKK